MQSNPKTLHIVREVWGTPHQNIRPDQVETILEENASFREPGVIDQPILEIALDTLGFLDRWVDEGRPRDPRWFADRCNEWTPNDPHLAELHCRARALLRRRDSVQYLSALWRSLDSELQEVKRKIQTFEG